MWQTSEEKPKIKLFADKDEFSDNSDELRIILDQYRLFAEMLDSHYQRTQEMDRFYISFNVVSLTGMLLAIQNRILVGRWESLFVIIPISIFCILWFYSITSGRRQTSVKHQVLQDIESRLPVRPFCDEWYDKWEQGRKITHVAKYRAFVPFLFVIMYITIGYVWFTGV